MLELVNAVAYLGIVALVYPIFKQRSEPMALLYLGFRIVEFVMQMLSDLSPLLLLTASENFTNSNSVNPDTFEVLSSTLLALRFWSNQMVFITYGLGAIIFYYISYQLKIFPRFLSVWGIIGAPLVLINVLFDSCNINLGVDLGLVMGLNEIILGIWLIVKGFEIKNINNLNKEL